jgi:hypothetical protein
MYNESGPSLSLDGQVHRKEKYEMVRYVQRILAVLLRSTADSMFCISKASLNVPVVNSYGSRRLTAVFHIFINTSDLLWLKYSLKC